MRESVAVAASLAWTVEHRQRAPAWIGSSRRLGNLDAAPGAMLASVRTDPEALHCGAVSGGRGMAGNSCLSARTVALLVVVGLGIAAAACTPYQYAGNRPVALAITVNGPGPMSPAGAPR